MLACTNGTHTRRRVNVRTVADFDVLLDLAVVSIVLVVFIRQAPFVAREGAPWLEHAKDLVVDPWDRRKVESGSI